MVFPGVRLGINNPLLRLVPVPPSSMDKKGFKLIPPGNGNYYPIF